MSDKDTKIESTQVYELGFHLVPTLGDDTVGKAFDNVEKLIAKVGGNVVSKSEPALLNLEYTMEKVVDSVKSKYNTAYFSWIIFEGGDVKKLADELEQDSHVLRNLLIKTDQRESISSAEVSRILSGEEEKTKEETGEEKTEQESVESENSEVIEEEAEEANEDAKESDKSDDEKVDEAIDELVK